MGLEYKLETPAREKNTEVTGRDIKSEKSRQRRKKMIIKKQTSSGISLVAQWLGSHLPTQGT